MGKRGQGGGGTKRASRSKGTYGLYAKNFPKSVQWKVDQDYGSVLTQDEREWLAAFNDAYYGADFRSNHGQDEWTVEERREAYRDKNRANRDAYVIADVSGRMARIPDLERHRDGTPCEFDVAAVVTDTEESPEYLESEEYRRAVSRVRAVIPERGTKAAPTPKQTIETRRAWARLNRIRNNGEDPT